MVGYNGKLGDLARKEGTLPYVDSRTCRKVRVLGFEALACEFCGLLLLLGNKIICETVGTGVSQRGKGTL